MSADTKAKALEKLAAVRVKIAYPDKWRDYSGLAIKDNDLYGDVARSIQFDWDFRARRLGGPVDKSEWGMTPPPSTPTTNPVGNEIVFPPPSCSRRSSIRTATWRSTTAASAR